jgi:glycosyltransferase involved in cell wall biosynthesis
VETFQDADVEILAPTSDEALVADGANVRRLWRKEKTQSDLGKVIDYLATKTPDMLVVQFNFAFFEHGDLDALLKSAAGMGIVTVVIMHTTTDPQDAPGFHVHEIAGGLAAASRVIVHNLEDVANLAALGIVDNVLRLPHGVRRGQALVSRPAPGACPVIATFGFCFPNKGLLEIVKAVRYLKDGGTPVRLRMFNALHPDSSSRSTLRAVRAEISALKLEDDIELHSDFLDLDLVDREIAKADLFVNPYQTTNESASGAVRIGLRNKVPTLVTPLAIFDELGEVVSRAPGRRPQDLAVGIRRALEDARDPAAAEEVQARIEDWLVEHDFKQQSMRLGKIGRSFKIKMMLEGMH